MVYFLRASEWLEKATYFEKFASAHPKYVQAFL